MNYLHKISQIARDRGAGYLAGAVYRRLFHSPIPSFHDYAQVTAGSSGLEIGGPSGVFKAGGLLPLYDVVGSLDNCNFGTHTVWEGTLDHGGIFQFSASRPAGRQYVLEGVDLSEIPDCRYDFLLSCHMLEHTANPIKALRSWHRIVKENGALILLLPDKEWTFDHQRPVTTLDHLAADFEADTSEDDLTHLPEILDLHDLERDPEAGGFEQFRTRSEANPENRCLHHHVFDLGIMRQMLEYSGWSVRLMERHAPDHLMAIATSVT